MKIQDIYYKIRPMAKLHSGEKLKIHPIAQFIISATASLLIGFFGGTFLWLSVGFNPDNSGGTFIFILGSILSSSISIAFIKKKAIFYGMNMFTFIVCILLAISYA
jgi:hypothetical protein